MVGMVDKLCKRNSSKWETRECESTIFFVRDENPLF